MIFDPSPRSAPSCGLFLSGRYCIRMDLFAQSICCTDLVALGTVKRSTLPTCCYLIHTLEEHCKGQEILRDLSLQSSRTEAQELFDQISLFCFEIRQQYIYVSCAHLYSWKTKTISMIWWMPRCLQCFNVINLPVWYTACISVNSLSICPYILVNMPPPTKNSMLSKVFRCSFLRSSPVGPNCILTLELNVKWTGAAQDRGACIGLNFHQLCETGRGVVLDAFLGWLQP